MLAKFLAILSVLLVVRAMSSTTETSVEGDQPFFKKETNLCPCGPSNISVTFQDSMNQIPNTMHGLNCVCHPGSKSYQIRDDYRYTPGIGAHKLHTRGAVWNDARKMCNDEGGHLAIINSMTEATVLLEMFKKSGPIKSVGYQFQAYLGIHDLYKEGEWVSIHGDSLFKTGYTVWSEKWGAQPDNGGGAQHCGTLLNEGGMDDVNCNVEFAFFCEIPLTYHFH